MRYASQIAGMIFQTRSKAFQHTAGGRNLPCFGCDCGRILESAGILLLRQECEARRRLLAEGELAACPCGTKNPGAEYLGILIFWNGTSQTGQASPASVRESTFTN